MLNLRISAIAALALALPVFSGCDEVKKATIVRTSDSPLVIERTENVPVYKTECSTYMVWGADPSCGYHTVCSTHHHSSGGSYNNHSGHHHGNHNGPHHNGNHGNHHNGGHYNPGYNPGNHTSCHSVMNSCHHPETRCVDVLSHHVRTTLRLRFDQNALLLPGETENINLTMSGRYTNKTVNLDIDSARYVYNYPRTLSVSLYNATELVEVPVTVNKVKAVRPPNNIRIIEARYTDAQTLRIVFEDPYRFVRDIRQTVFNFSVKRGLNSYVDAEIRSVDLQATEGPYVVEIRKGSPEWNRDPRSGKEHTLRWSVDRESILFTDRTSEKEKMDIRF